MSGLEVVGGVAAVIGILDAAVKIYDSARKDLKLSETFQTVRRRLPIILDTLQTCQQHLEPIEDSLLCDVREALKEIVEACDDKAAQLRRLFEKVIPEDSDGWKQRYQKFARGVGKGHKVEELTLSITEEVQLLVNHHAVKSATPAQESDLDQIVEEMKSIQSSAAGGAGVGMHFNSDGGPQTNNINQGSGQQINNNAPVTTPLWLCRCYELR